MAAEPYLAASFASPCGPLLAVVNPAGALVRLEFLRDQPPPADGDRHRGLPLRIEPGAVARVVRQLDEYFRGERRLFELALAPSGPPFDERVWMALRAIPYGTTTSYGAIARQLGNPGAARAVGRANGANPIAIVVPCHRVIGADGTLTGFGGGLPNKELLLRLEGALPPQQGALAL